MRKIQSISNLSMVYGAGLAVGTFALQWLENLYVISLFSTEIYIMVLAIFFTFLGIWIGSRFTVRLSANSFEKNKPAVMTLGLTVKEIEVLELLALGGSNQDLAEQLHVSTSTIKSHLVHLYRKLDVSRRTQAVQRARTLKIIP